MSSSNLSSDPLRDPSTISSLQTLSHVLETTIGPKGKLKLLENSRELTSTSKRLLNHISIKNIISKIVVTTAKTQIGTFNDGGLMCALLTLKLVCPMASDSGRSLPLVGTLYEHFAVEFLTLLKEEASFEVDFSNLRHLKAVVLTILSSKPGCLLSRLDRDHICSLLLRAFLECVPSNGKSAMIPDCFRFLTVDGLPPKESRLLKGVLVPIPETDEKRFFTQKDGRPIRVALFKCSLAGDADWPVGGLETTSLDLVIGTTLKILDSVVSQLVLDGIDFVFCQKVVHPRMKKRLQKAGIMILDRLGSEAAKYIQYISGGTSITSLSCKLSYGTLSNINIEHLGQKSFLLLTSNDIPLFSIVLAHYNEEASAELKIVCRQAMDSLFRILQNPRVCFGGGCSELRTGKLLANKVRGNLDAIKNETGCTAGQVLESLNTFLRAIANTCVSIHQGKLLDFATESTHGHLWKLHGGHFPTAEHRCQCGSHQAASVDPASWSFLSDSQHVFSPISISSDKSSLKASQTTTSIEVLTNANTSPSVSSISSDLNRHSQLTSDDTNTFQDEVATSSNQISASQLPANSNSSPKCIPLLNPVYTESDAACRLSAIVTSSPICIPLTSTVPESRLSTNINSLACDSLSNDMPTCHPSSSTTHAPSSSTIPAPHLFDNAATSPSNIGLDVESSTSKDLILSSVSSISTSPSKSYHSTSDGDNSIYLDELSSKLNSLSLAFETASLLLRTTVCINNLPT